MKRVVVVFANSPWCGVDAAAGFDVSLALLAFEHELQAGFIGAGANLLVASDCDDERAQRWRMVAALAHHGATRLLCCGKANATLASGLSESGIECVDSAAFAAWLAEADHVLAF